MRQGFCWQRGVVAGPRGQQGSLPGGKGGCEGSVPKQQRDRSFQSTQRGEGSVAAKNEKLDRSRGNLATIVIAIAIAIAIDCHLSLQKPSAKSESWIIA